ncbi:DUF1703-domain-containing protein [Rhizophagus irregularis]|uniref:DUF1703-domain-containing protein n=1 Tax=Rhizophagus irregularis TaxID=588596 RepID=A0A2N0P351_9GLOM|nr:DUF1703-domain-containing protein [Rhizophagus irregularis]
MSNLNDIMIIFCLVLGDSIEDRFTINISRTEGKKIGREKISFEKLNIDHFKKLLCEYYRYTFIANELRLWKVSISTKPEDKDDKLTKLQDVPNVHAGIDIKKQLGGVPLNPDDYIKNIFVEDPPDKHIHIIIEKPAKEPPLKRARTEEEVPPWPPSCKRQKMIKYGTATLFAGKSIPIGWDSFSKIVNGGCTFLDKTSLISEFIECNSKVSLIVRPRRFGKTINLTMLRDFFSIPIHPDNKKYRRELFVDMKIMEKQSLFDTHFCKYPVIFLSLKNFDGCETWSKMKIKLFGMFAMLYKNHNYVYDKLDPYEKTRFSQIRSEDENCKRMDDVLVDLSRYLKDYHGKECIVLIDEYDHPLDIAYRYQYYEEARGFFASLFGALLKSNDDNLEKALLVGVSRVAKSGYLSGLNNMQVFPMHDQEYADKFGFTEDEVSIILQHYKKSQAKKVKDWYDGYMASNGTIPLYNPWSINKFISTNRLEAHWVDTGGTATIKQLLWHSNEDFRNKTIMLLRKDAVNVEIMGDIDYNLLSQCANDTLWTLLYYGGYLTMNKEGHLYIPNTEVFTEWKGWLNRRISFNPDTMLEMLLQCNLTKFEKELPIMIMESLSYFDVPDNLAETNYHMLMVGILSPVRYHNYELSSNREAGEGRFDVRIVPNTEKVIYEVSILMDFKIYDKKKKNIDMEKKAKEALDQIKEKKYRTGIRTTKLVECGIVFQGKRAYVLSRVLHKKGDQWVEEAK